ncbi:MAG: peptidoglycan DD-metalloendopeptidase family protein [Lachnospiraceae bacterium]|nr:peptidoglycan DD-metalloendopeptidase family protein [Lachnospiraceae bacterium]
MKKVNTWLTVAIGGVLTVIVAVVVIMWSGNWTKENPYGSQESTDRQIEANDQTDAVLKDDREEETKRPTNETKNPNHETWEVEPLPEETEVADNTQKPENSKPVISTPVVTDPTVGEPETEEAKPVIGTPVVSLDFREGQALVWPVEGNVIQHYSMDTTVYFPTLEQYKCSPAIEIQSEAGTPVIAPANAKVVEAGEDARIGRYVRLDIGNGYQLVLGQLTDLMVMEGDYVAQGTRIGAVAVPTRYFVVEGDNLYFQMYRGEETVDPLDHLE